MLILKAFVNDRQIDEIRVQNIEDLGEGFCRYEIRKPESTKLPLLTHKRCRGWKPLALAVLSVLVGSGK